MDDFHDHDRYDDDDFYSPVPTVENQNAAAVLRDVIMPALDNIPERVNHTGRRQGFVMTEHGSYDSTCATIELSDGEKFTVQIHAGATLPSWAEETRAGTAGDQRASGILKNVIEPAVRDAVLENAGLGTVNGVNADLGMISFRLSAHHYCVQISHSRF